MTPEERDRLVRVEEQQKSLDDWLRSIAKDVADIKRAAYMGKGAWALLIKLGALLAAIVAAGGWMADHLLGRH